MAAGASCRSPGQVVLGVEGETLVGQGGRGGLVGVHVNRQGRVPLPPDPTHERADAVGQEDIELADARPVTAAGRVEVDAGALTETGAISETHAGLRVGWHEYKRSERRTQENASEVMFLPDIFLLSGRQKHV